jgi:hypothetical protein
MTRNESFESVIEETERQYNLGSSAKNSQQQEYFSQFKGKPFYIWDREAHAREYDRTKALYGKPMCCFNHILPVGLPKKNGEAKPLFPYEQTIYNTLMTTETGDIKKNKHVYVLKAVGLGVTEFCLRWIAWMCLEDDKLRGSQVVIITAPSILVATGLIKRLKALFPDVSFAEKETDCTLNGVTIRAFPSHLGLDSARGLEKPSIILIDEADFAPISLAKDIRDIAERYIPKSNPYIILVSTPNAPEGLMEEISRESEDECIYHRIFLPYTVGVGHIYSEAEVVAARASPSFPREMNLAFIGQEGNVFTHESIETAIELGIEAVKNEGAPPHLIRQDTHKIMGVDAGFGSSKFAIVVTEFLADNKYGKNPIIRVLYAEEFERPDFNDMINRIVSMYHDYVIANVYVDSANPEIISSIKTPLGDRPDWVRYIARLKAAHPRWLNLAKYMKVVPVSFGTDGREMLAHTKKFLDNQWVAIHPDFHKLIVALRTAVSTDGLLSKAETSHDDLLDALRLALSHYEEKQR